MTFKSNPSSEHPRWLWGLGLVIWPKTSSTWIKLEEKPVPWAAAGASVICACVRAWRLLVVVAVRESGCLYCPSPAGQSSGQKPSGRGWGVTPGAEAAVACRRPGHSCPCQDPAGWIFGLSQA